MSIFTDVWNAIVDALTWFVELIKQVFLDAAEMLLDLVLLAVDSALSAVAELINAIPAPHFLEVGMQSILMSTSNCGTFNGDLICVGGLSQSIVYFLDRAGFSNALAILGAGLTFRLIRKIVTLGQW